MAGLNSARLMVFFTTSVLIPIPVAYLSVSFKKTLKSPPQLVNVLPNTTDGKLNISKKTKVLRLGFMYLTTSSLKHLTCHIDLDPFL